MELQQSLEGERNMSGSDLMPKKVVSVPEAGQVIFYEGISITLNEDGQLTVDDVTDAVCVVFSRSGGMNCSWRGFAVLLDVEVKVFEGPSTGFGMLTREMVLAACKL